MVLYKNRCKDLIAEFPIIDCHITSLLVCPLQGALLAGTSKGTLRIYTWPMVVPESPSIHNLKFLNFSLQQTLQWPQAHNQVQ